MAMFLFRRPAAAFEASCTVPFHAELWRTLRFTLGLSGQLSTPLSLIASSVKVAWIL